MELETINRNTTRPLPEIVNTSRFELNDEDRVSKIAVTAYYKAEARGYEPGHEIQDWLEAEAEILHKN